jgi:hypothetical protein
LATLQSWVINGFEWDAPDVQKQLCATLLDLLNQRIEMWPIVALVGKPIAKVFRSHFTESAMDLLSEGLRRREPAFCAELTFEEVAQPFIDYIHSTKPFKDHELLPRFVLLVNYAEALEVPLDPLLPSFWMIAADFGELTVDVKRAVSHFFRLVCAGTPIAALEPGLAVIGEVVRFPFDNSDKPLVRRVLRALAQMIGRAGSQAIGEGEREAVEEETPMEEIELLLRKLGELLGGEA